MRLFKNRKVIVWLLLMIATLVSWKLGTDHGLYVDERRIAAFGVMGIAFIKVHFVGADFMEVREAPLLLRLWFAAWVVITLSVVIGIYMWA